MYACLKYFFLSLFLLPTLVASAGDISVEPLLGEVFLQKGQGFQRVKTPVTVRKGQKIFVREGGSAKITYSENCVLPLKDGVVITIRDHDPCSPKPMGLTKASKEGAQAFNSDEGLSTILATVIGGADVAGLMTGALLGFSGDNTKPASAD